MLGGLIYIYRGEIDYICITQHIRFVPELSPKNGAKTHDFVSPVFSTFALVPKLDGDLLTSDDFRGKGIPREITTSDKNKTNTKITFISDYAIFIKNKSIGTSQGPEDGKIMIRLKVRIVEKIS